MAIVSDPPNRLDVSRSVYIRTATLADIPRLEWFGRFTHFRYLFRRAYHDQLVGRRLMLVADCNQFPIGCLFISFQSNRRAPDTDRACAYIYSLRVLEIFQGNGIGTRLMIEAEKKILERELTCAVIAVAKVNHGARRLYERLGYEVYCDDPGHWHYTDHLGHVRYVSEPCWLLQKSIGLR